MCARERPRGLPRFLIVDRLSATRAHGRLFTIDWHTLALACACGLIGAVLLGAFR